MNEQQQNRNYIIYCINVFGRALQVECQASFLSARQRFKGIPVFDECYEAEYQLSKRCYIIYLLSVNEMEEDLGW